MNQPASAPSRRLTLLIPQLSGGGAEKVIVRLANHWAARSDRVTLITLSNTATDSYRLSEAVRRVPLDLQGDSCSMLGAVMSNWRRIRALRKAILASEPQAVVSFIDQMNVLTLLATFRRRFPVIVSERVDPRYHPIGSIWNSLRKRTYPGAECLVVQTDAIAQTMRELIRGGRVEVIANGIDPPSVELLPMPQRRKVIVAAGRLVLQKGFDMLIEAFAMIAERHPDWSLEIYGTGPLEAALRKQIDESGMANRIKLAGWTAELPSTLASSSVFVLCSRYEGFPNVLLDAMACGAACVSFACPSGPKKIIRDAVDGVLVARDDVAALADAVNTLLSDLELRTRLGQRAREVVERFSYERFFGRWNRLVDDLIALRR